MDNPDKPAADCVPPPYTETLLPTPGQPTPAPFGLPARIGRYRVLRLLGEGGFGRVYLAQDDVLDRPVAVKVPRSDRISRPEDVDSYLTEARILTRLEHPGIVPVYDADRTDDGLCYVVSKFIDGHDLAYTIKHARPARTKAVELVAAVAEALHYAHTRGLVHRDVKPANILIDDAGKPYVADFGLALEDEDYGRGTGYVGTPAYMSPEQARGEGHRVDGRSDIFGLGVVFFELLTGKRPFRGNTAREVLDEVARAEFRPPRQIDDTIPRELERICQKALSKRASERYSTASDMADDLRHWRDFQVEGRNPASAGQEFAGPGEPEPPTVPDLGKDAFISYASLDKDAAFRLCRLLEEQGIRCWIAPRDVPPDTDCGAAIVGAIEGTKATVLLLSSHANTSIDVAHEVERATSKRKRVIPVRLEDVLPGPSLELHLSTLRQLDAWRLSADQVAAQLAVVLRSDGHTTPAPTPLPTQPVTPPPTTPLGSDSDNRPIKIIPKGLRSFDAHDADFFLELLPGPRDRDGLPDSIRFWKRTIEQTDPDLTFKVGLIYGPSGCGKSSLVKAGLLPRLASHLLSIYVEATPEETEARVLKGLRKACPDLTPQLGLVETLAALRRGQFVPAGKKVLIVLDQFEQWLHAHAGAENTELVAALRQCDGGRVQAIVMVRDDFWMAATRFMRELEIRLVEGENSAAVDLFDRDHARKVLAEFGRAFGRLPQRMSETTREQQDFLQEAVTDLSHDGKVISVRLSLFAEMVKGKPWTPATLKDVGGIEGVGVIFLEETFSASTAPPEHRLHQKAARRVLKALLPDSGTDIKGQMRSRQELLEASGQSARPRDFTDLLQILDGELRLITPTDPEGIDSEEGNRDGRKTAGDCPDFAQSSEQNGTVPLPEGRFATVPGNRPAGGKYYQLTHDYLVPSLREWLTRKQKETRRGRAELRLADRSSLWNAKPENRFLPSVSEWVRIRALTKPKDWTEPQRKMMRKAGRVHGMRGLGTAVLVAALTGLGLNVRERVAEANRATIADGLVKQVLKANTAGVPSIVASMKDYRRWVDPALKQALANAGQGSPEELNARLALLPVDAAQVGPLHDRMLASGPDVAVVIRQSLEPHRESLTPKLWVAVQKAGAGDQTILPAASALALFDPQSASWDGSGDKVAGALVRVNPILLGGWIEALRPVGPRLAVPLAAIFRDRQRPETERAAATSILVDYAKDDGGLLAGLLMDADPPAYAALFPVVERLKPQVVPLFQAEIEKSPRSDWQDTAPPAISEEQKDRLVERQARAAVALVRMGHAATVWPLLKHSADPRLRSFIVNWLRPLGADPKLVAAGIDGIDARAVPAPVEGQQRMDAVLFHPETSMRRALILALGTCGTEGLSTGEREPLTVKLLDLYRNDPDAGIHGAAEWTLRQWKEQARINEVDAELIKFKDWGHRRWFVNGQGQTFAVIDGPVEFAMGSPVSEPGRHEGELLHRVRIKRRFAVATKEVTVEQYQRFVAENPSVDHGNNDKDSPDGKGPMNGVTWYHAAAYCNWLSKQDRQEACYEPNAKGEYAEGMKPVSDFLGRTGYRLPTEAEWEYACRSAAMTSRYYGVSVELLGKYAWFLQNSQEHAWPCGQLQPNDLGLYDMLGNVYEWCQEQYGRYPQGGGNTTKTDMIESSYINDETPRLVRGGSFYVHPALLRSANRNWNLPLNRNSSGGFRPSRTYP